MDTFTVLEVCGGDCVEIVWWSKSEWVLCWSEITKNNNNNNRWTRDIHNDKRQTTTDGDVFFQLFQVFQFFIFLSFSHFQSSKPLSLPPSLSLSISLDVHSSFTLLFYSISITISLCMCMYMCVGCGRKGKEGEGMGCICFIFFFLFFIQHFTLSQLYAWMIFGVC